MKQALRLLSGVALIVPVGLTFGIWQAAPVAAASAPPSPTPGAPSATSTPERTPPPTPTFSSSPTPTPMSTPSPTPSATPTHTATATATPSPTPSASPAPASTGSPTPSADPSTANLCSPGGPGLGAPGAPGLGFYNGQVCIGTTELPNGSFQMIDPARPGLSCGPVVPGISISGELGPRFTQPNNAWGNGQPADLTTACVDAMYAGGAEWDMLRAWLGRNGMDGEGHAAGIGVNFLLDGAFFAPPPQPAVLIGRVAAPGADPEEPTMLPLDALGRQWSSLDIVAHEFGHMVFYTTPGGASTGLLENNALNEGTADIMAHLTIAFANNPKVPLTYTFGSQIRPGNPYRVMYNPSLGSEGGPMCYSPAIFTKPDGSPETGRGHSESSLLSRWFYLLAEGSSPAGGRVPSPTCDGSTLTGLGIKTAGQIFYNGLLQKTPTWTYRDARSATLTAALRLFPSTCTVFDKVKAAWNAVSVPALPNEPTCGVSAPAARVVGLPMTGAAPFTGSGASAPTMPALLLLDALGVAGVVSASIVWLRPRRSRRRRS